MKPIRVSDGRMDFGEVAYVYDVSAGVIYPVTLDANVNWETKYVYTRFSRTIKGAARAAYRFARSKSGERRIDKALQVALKREREAAFTLSQHTAEGEEAL
jgi:hypothetical protein